MDVEIKEKVYISGKITGLLNYADAFNRAEQSLRNAGYDVYNPCNMCLISGWQWEDYMRYDISRLLECDYIYPLKNWRKSKGARLEMKLAKKLGIKILTLQSESHGNARERLF